MERNKDASVPVPRRRATDRLLTGAGHEADLEKLLHELEVREIKLEMQNEELRRTRDEVETALNEYSDLYDFAPVGYFTLDGKGVIHKTNLTGAALVGIERAHLINRRFSAFVPAEMSGAFDAFLRAAFAGETKESHEVMLVREGGHPLWAHIEAQASASGQECRLAVIDITERKRIEDAQLFLLQCGVSGDDFFQSLARYLAMQLGMDYVCIDRLEGGSLRAKTVAVYFDGRFEDNVAYTLKDTPCGDVVGKTICSFSSGVRHSFPRDAALQAMEAEGYMGATLWSSQGQPIGLIAMISRKPLVNHRLVESIVKLVAVRAAGELERTDAEEALREARDELELRVEERTAQLKGQAELLDLAHDAIIVRDASGRIVFWNTGAEITYGWTKDEVLGLTTDSLLKTRFPAPLQDLIDTVSREGRWEGELIHTGKDGRRITALSRWTERRGEGGWPEGMLEINRDITDRKVAEGQLRQAQKMEAVGALAGGIAHDFNNILAAILGFTEMALDDIPPESPARGFLEHALKSGLRGRDLITQILTFSRKAEPRRGPVSLSPVIKETVQLLRASIPTTVRIVFATRAISDTIHADPVEVQQILMNLATNGAHAMEEKGGVLEIMLTDIEGPPDSSAGEADLAPGEYVRLTVKDSGAGMTPGVQKRVFEPFFTTREVGKGTGLGLFAVWGIVKSLHGSITVESAPGMGSTFRVFLPKVKTDRKAEPVETGEAPGGKERILFVDDEEDLAELGKGRLEKLGYTVTAMTDSVKALKSFSKSPSRFDLVFTDQTMPGIAGIDLARKVLKIRPHMPVILCTGYSDGVTPEIAAAAGIREFLMKPLSRGELAVAVRRALDAKPEA
jgi:PAS domain S-box-containing protein